MTRKVFWEDPSLTQLDTRIAAVNGNEVTLEATIFYALSGGQESDDGTIAGRPVRAARKDGTGIVYTLDPEHGLVPGQTVTVTIDGARRRRLMRLHFAAELVLELVTRRLPQARRIGAHIAADKARIDFQWDRPLTPLLPAVLAEAEEIIAADHAIVTGYDDEAAQRRFWQVEGFARVPCGGTHLHRTGAVGRIALRRRNVGKGKERIEITLADTERA